MSGAKVINNPMGAFGYTDLRTQLFSEEAEFKAAGAIAGAPQVVGIGTDGTVTEIGTATAAALAIGIAVNNCASGEIAKVVVAGIAENVPVDGACAAGALLKRSVTTTGSVAASATPAAGETIGIAINASSSNTVDVWVCKAP